MYEKFRKSQNNLKPKTVSNLINTQYNPEWADQNVDPGGHGAVVGCCDDALFVNKLSRNIRFEWMEKQPVIQRHLNPGEHVKVKPRADVKNGYKRFIDLCRKMHLRPSTEKRE